MANGAATFGFLNPTIYELGVRANYGQYFHDIVSGSNGKYSAVVDYDLVTGWGSFDGPTLLEALVAVR